MLQFKARSPRNFQPEINRSRFIAGKKGKEGMIMKPGSRFARVLPNNHLEEAKIISCQSDASGVPHIYFERITDSNLPSRSTLAWEAFLRHYPRGL